MDKRMMIQTLQEIHHKSGELLQMMGSMGQRENGGGYNGGGYNMGQRDNEGRYTRNDGGNRGMGERYIDPWMY